MGKFRTTVVDYCPSLTIENNGALFTGTGRSVVQGQVSIIEVSALFSVFLAAPAAKSCVHTISQFFIERIIRILLYIRT